MSKTSAEVQPPIDWSSVTSVTLSSGESIRADEKFPPIHHESLVLFGVGVPEQIIELRKAIDESGASIPNSILIRRSAILTVRVRREMGPTK
jgi:hypothetical protein